MKNVILVLALSLTFGKTALAKSSDVLMQYTGLAKTCAHKIELAAMQIANSESKTDPKHEYKPILSPGADLIKNGQNSAAIDILFTLTNANEYWYDVTISDKARCAYSIQSEQEM